MNPYSHAVPHDDVMASLLKTDPAFARECLDVALEEGDMRSVMILMRQLAVAHGGVAEIARRTGLNKQSLHRTLSAKGNPRFTTILSLFRAFDMHLSAQV